MEQTMNTQLRNKRKRLRNERIILLQEVDRLQAKLNKEKDRNKQTKIVREIARLGKLLQQKVLVSVPDSSYDKSGTIELNNKRRKNKVRWSMDYQEYIELKKRGKTDDQIALMKDATINQLYKWKSDNHITKLLWMEAK